MTHLCISRRELMATAGAALGTAAFAGPLRAQAKPEKSKVVLAVGGKTALYYITLTLAERLGYFKDEGLDVEINDFAGGAKSLQALMGGSADVVAGAYEHCIRMQQRGQPILGFALMSQGMQVAIALLAKHADKVKSPADAKGLKVGISAPGSSTHMLLNFWLAKGGLKGSDVAAIGVGAGATVVAAVEKGEIDAVSQTDPAVAMLERKGAIKVVLDTRTPQGNVDAFGGPMPAACLYCQPDFVKKNPVTAQLLANAVVRTCKWVQKASAEDVAKTVPEAYLLGDRELYKTAFEKMRGVLSPDGTMPAGGPETCLKFLAAGDPAIDPAKARLAETWTNDFVKVANQKYK